MLYPTYVPKIKYYIIIIIIILHPKFYYRVCTNLIALSRKDNKNMLVRLVKTYKLEQSHTTTIIVLTETLGGSRLEWS